MSYVYAGYAVALVSLSLYGTGLLLRRRRWERAAKASDGEEPVGPGGRS
jgi:hypothetical protein